MADRLELAVAGLSVPKHVFDQELDGGVNRRRLRDCRSLVNQPRTPSEIDRQPDCPDDLERLAR